MEDGIMAERYRVTLTDEERERPERLTRKGTSLVRMVRRALTLLLAARHATELPGILWPAWWLLVGLVASAFYLFGARLVPAPVSLNLPEPLYPPAAVVLAVLLLTPPHTWWVFLLEAYAFQVAVFLWMGYSPAATLTGYLANMVEALVGAILVRRCIQVPPRFDTLRQLAVYAVCVTIAAVIGATLGAASLLLTGRPYWPTWLAWFLGDVLATLLLAPTILLCISGRVWGPRVRSRRRAAEAGALLLALLAVGAFAFGTHSQDMHTAPALVYLPIPLLVWAAVRFGPRGLIGALTLTTVLAIAGVANGLGPFEGVPAPASTVHLPLFLLGVGVPLFCLAALVQESRRAAELAISEAALRATNEQLAELSRAKSDFLSIVSHEVRTPLGSIRGFSEMLRDDAVGPEERIEYAGLINAEAQRLGRLVDDLLDLDRLESGRVHLRLDLVDLRATITAALERAAPTTDGHILRADVGPSLPPLRGDPDQLAQVVGNLVTNAIKYSPRGGAITVGASREDEQVHLWVRDEGIGIPAAMLETVFERYARVESAEHRAIKGTGLGLPIVRQIAELHGGRAWAESQPGRGSRFHVTLPIAGPPGPR